MLNAPWWAKIGVKVALSRLPLSRRLWKQVGLFEAGGMDRPQYVRQVFANHFAHSTLQGCKGFTVLELGPGDSLLSGLVAKAHGAAKTWLVDSANFADTSPENFRAMAELLKEEAMELPLMDDLTTGEDWMQATNLHYGHEGLSSLKGIPTASVDFIFSHAVLEHVRAGEFLEYLQETRRVLKPEGLCSHTVDFRDHLGGGLNNLRFSPGLWESEWMVKSGFYTNRIRPQDMLEFFEKAGFEAQVLRQSRWPSLPIPRNKLHDSFRSLPDEALLVDGYDVVLKARP